MTLTWPPMMSKLSETPMRAVELLSVHMPFEPDTDENVMSYTKFVGTDATTAAAAAAPALSLSIRTRAFQTRAARLM